MEPEKQPVVEANGAAIPRIGLGTFGLEGREAATVTATALGLGYRHVDTAEMYGNEKEVGEGIRASGVPREAIFLTTKAWVDNVAPGRLEEAAERSIDKLGVGPVDLYLIHWPSPTVAVEASVRALCAVKQRGLARHVGVSNFPVALVERALAATTEPLVANQVEYHPHLDQRPLLKVLRENGMALTAYCPIARGRLAHDPLMAEIAERHGATVSQVALAWLIAQDGVVAIPKTSKEARLKENLGAYGVALSPDEVEAIHGLRRADGRMIRPAHEPVWDT